MKNKLSIIMLVLLLVGCQSKTGKVILDKTVNVSMDYATAPVQQETIEDSISYFLGLDIASGVATRFYTDIDKKMFIQGIAYGLGMKNVADIQKDTAIQAFINAFIAKMQQKRAEVNAQAEKAFLAENATKEGVVVVSDKLQYEPIKKVRRGLSPRLKDTVECHYKGYLMNGKVFDSSLERGKPTKFPLTGVIKGWQELIPKMKVGEKWRLFIASELAYGTNPRQGSGIEPNSLLIFEIELINVYRAK